MSGERGTVSPGASPEAGNRPYLTSELLTLLYLPTSYQPRLLPPAIEDNNIVITHSTQGMASSYDDY